MPQNRTARIVFFGETPPAKLGDTSGTVYLCANREAWKACRSRGLDAVRLDESRIRDKIDAINRWGYEAALRWIARQEDSVRFVLEAAFYDLRIYFIRLLKFLIVLEKVMAEKGITDFVLSDLEWTIFAPVLQSHFPGRVRLEPLREPVVQPRPSEAPLTGRVLGACANRASRIRMERWKRRGVPVTLVSGALTHLAPVLEKMPSGHGIVFCETSFQRDKALYCLKRGFAYVTLPDRDGIGRIPLDDASFFGPRGLVYQGRDFSGPMNAALRRAQNLSLMFRPFDAAALEGFLKGYPFRAVLLDEDFALRRMLFLTAEKCGIPCYTLSHGIPARRIFEEPPPVEARHPSSITFVHSPFEAETYRSLGYEASRIRTTGIPRYDRALALLRARKRPAAGPKIILYCTGSMVEYDFILRSAVTDILGSTNFCREWSERYLEDLARFVARRRDVRLWVKPHYADERLWRAALRRARLGSRACRLFSHQDDAMALIARADAVVTPESSVICEALMLEKPVVVVDYPGEFRGSRYDVHGVVQRVRNEEEMQNALGRALFDHAYRNEFARRVSRSRVYFAGEMDGGSSARVARTVFQTAPAPRLPAQEAAAR